LDNSAALVGLKMIWNGCISPRLSSNLPPNVEPPRPTTACPQKPPKKHQPIPSDITKRQRNWAGASTGSDHPLPLAHSAKSPHLPRASLCAQDRSRGAPSTHPKQPVPNPQSIQSPACPQSPILPLEPVPKKPATSPQTSPSGSGTGPEQALEAINLSPSRTARKVHTSPELPCARRTDPAEHDHDHDPNPNPKQQHLPHQLPCVTKYL
jgi:hypothetical protein